MARPNKWVLAAQVFKMVKDRGGSIPRADAIKFLKSHGFTTAGSGWETHIYGPAGLKAVSTELVIRGEPNQDVMEELVKLHPELAVGTDYEEPEKLETTSREGVTLHKGGRDIHIPGPVRVVITFLTLVAFGVAGYILF